MPATIARPDAAPAAPTATAAGRRRALLADALGSGASGLALLVGAAWLDGALGVPAWLLAALGGFYLVFAASLTGVARIGAPPPLVRLIGVGNLGWGVLSVAVLATDALTPSAAGIAVGVAQTAFVAVVGLLQLATVRRG